MDVSYSHAASHQNVVSPAVRDGNHNYLYGA